MDTGRNAYRKFSRAAGKVVSVRVCTRSCITLMILLQRGLREDSNTFRSTRRSGAKTPSKSRITSAVHMLNAVIFRIAVRSTPSSHSVAALVLRHHVTASYDLDAIDVALDHHALKSALPWHAVAIAVKS